MNEQPRYWFAAKTYGWGWGLPLTWEGWVVFALYFGLLIVCAKLFPPDREPGQYAGAMTLLTSALIVICYAKGEPPRWRWGKK